MKKLAPLLFLLSSFSAFASEECSVELHAKIYRAHPEKNLRANEIIKTSDCSVVELSKLTSIISNANGTVGADFLRNELAKENTSLAISPAKISIYQLNEAFKNQILPNSAHEFHAIRLLNGHESLQLSENETLKVSCEPCNSTGEKSIKVEVYNSLTDARQTQWATAKVMTKIKAIKAKQSLSFQRNSLQKSDFYEAEILTERPENILTNLENIQFFKANKNIPQDAIIQNNDLQPVNVINYGTPVSVTLKSANISLQKMATPLRSARYGETVELRDINNKTIHGKAIDFNKVIIEL